jgi:hypothetical protein
MGRLGHASQRDARKMVFGKPRARSNEVTLWIGTVTQRSRPFTRLEPGTVQRTGARMLSAIGGDGLRQALGQLHLAKILPFEGRWRALARRRGITRP